MKKLDFSRFLFKFLHFNQNAPAKSKNSMGLLFMNMNMNQCLFDLDLNKLALDDNSSHLKSPKCFRSYFIKTKCEQMQSIYNIFAKMSIL